MLNNLPGRRHWSVADDGNEGRTLGWEFVLRIHEETFGRLKSMAKIESGPIPMIYGK